MTTLSLTIDEFGATAPTYAECLAGVTANMQSIYGSDINIDPDTQDGQLLGVLAQAIYDSAQAGLATYLAYSPSYAQGTNLASLVKINGLKKQAATNSTVVVTITGQAGTIISSGVVRDTQSNLWDLPTTVTIPVGGSINVTATAQQAGAISAAAGTVTSIYTPTRGWQTVTNAAEASIGVAVESDATLRKRQTVSTALPAQAITTSIAGLVANVTGVTRSRVYENDTDTIDDYLVPPKSIAVVVEGGDIDAVASAVAMKKPPGCQTYGTVPVSVTDSVGVSRTINLFVLSDVLVYVAVTIKARTGYTSAIGAQYGQALADYLSANEIGEPVIYEWVRGVASPSNNPSFSTFSLVSLAIGKTASPTGTVDLDFALNESALGDVSAITLTVT